MKSNEEHNAIKRIQNGDSDSFEWLVKKYQKPLFIMTANFLNQSHRVEDMVQDVFLAAYKNIGKFNPDRSSFSTWIFRIARNKCLNEIRKKKEKIISQHPEMESSDNPSKSLIEKEMFDRLDRALNDLSSQDRSIFILAELEEMPYSQIAEIEDIKIGTVKSRLS